MCVDVGDIIRMSGSDHVVRNAPRQLHSVRSDIARCAMDEDALRRVDAPVLKTICHAVHATTGTEAASMNPICRGIFASFVADATAYSAYPPVNRAPVATNSGAPRAGRPA